MRLVQFASIFFLGLAVGCNRSSSFEQKVWLDNPEMTDTDNPRAHMVDDLMKNQLKLGMTRAAVLDLLGKPYKDVIEQRLPKGTVVPDSLSLTQPDKFKPENQKRALAAYNEFYRLHSQPDTLLLYPVGWSTMDPNFLAVKLTGKGLVGEYWVEQH